jgi:hypothetical protein
MTWRIAHNKLDIPNGKDNQVTEKKFKSVYDQVSPKRKVSKDEHQNSSAIAPIDLMTPTGTCLICPSSLQEIKEVQALFTEMVGAMTALDEQGLTTTTLILNAKPGSILSGTEITILEYNTAPKDFNIQIQATPQAVQLLDNHLGELVAAFNVEHLPFKINRLDIYHHAKRNQVRKNELQAQKEELTQDDGSALPLG